MIFIRSLRTAGNTTHMGQAQPLILTIDVGTGTVRAALVDMSGVVVGMRSVSHASSFPQHGWVEQRPQDWWDGARQAIAATLGDTGLHRSVAAIACCGQMHAPVLVDRRGELVLERVPLWNDKRAAATATRLEAQRAGGTQVNPATSAWPGVKLAWLSEHQPEALAASDRMMMPKDYINFRLTGSIAVDWSEAGSSYLTDPESKDWCDDEVARMGLSRSLFPPILRSDHIVGRVSRAAADATGLPEGLPVLVGAGDFPVAILGSGVVRTGMISDVTGTSFLLTRLVADPFRHRSIMNLGTVTGGWGAFAVVDAAGDAIRWASRSIDRGMRSYEALSADAASVAAGADGLIFLPYLTGERLGQGPGSRAAFVGLTARHEAPHLHRAIMEGVVLAMEEAFRPVALHGGMPDAIVSTAGGARSELWLRIKADVFGCPLLPTVEPEAGLVGCAALGFAGLGYYASPAEAAQTMVRYRAPVLPDPDRVRRYAELADAFAAVRRLTPELNSIMGRLQ